MLQPTTAPVFHKIHDAFHKNTNNQHIVPADTSKCAIYFIRNPLDVAVSFAHHNKASIDTAIENMCNPSFSFCNQQTGISYQFRQKLMDWSSHVNSWTNQQQIPCLTLKYEDMLNDSLNTFGKSVNFVGLRYNLQQIKQAIGNSSFNNLKLQEEKEGFNEKQPLAGSFFRKGIAGDWKNALGKQQIDKIIKHHGEAMEKFGYL
ncbi:MAG: sulfotransferase domain-containing protein [Bacteroidales bacterium]|nr:sulfotransferase domain-containing protein [Bacteroidales bacterium]